MEWVEGKVKVICTISNFENQAVSLRYTLYTTDGTKHVDEYSRSVTIGPSQTIVKSALLTSGGYYNCYASADKIEECQLVTKFKQVAKQRTVTKYRTVDKERKVTRYASLFKKWTGQVNW